MAPLKAAENFITAAGFGSFLTGADGRPAVAGGLAYCRPGGRTLSIVGRLDGRERRVAAAYGAGACSLERGWPATRDGAIDGPGASAPRTSEGVCSRRRARSENSGWLGGAGVGRVTGVADPRPPLVASGRKLNGAVIVSSSSMQMWPGGRSRAG